jgi:RimJ/RimL family protein N-acetyltransferase
MLEKIKEQDYKFYLKTGRALESIDNINIIELYANEMRYGDDYLPFAYTRYSDGSIILRFLPDLKDFALEFINKTDDLFSEKMNACIYKSVADYLKQKFNLVPNTEKYSTGFGYGVSDKNKLNLDRKQRTTIKFDETCEYEIIEKYVFVDRNNPGVFFGTLIDGRIVSVAKRNNAHEIGIGTHEDYRGKGYAVSNVAAMAEYILGKGLYVYYETNNLNAGSRRTAEAAGFTEIYREQFFWFKNIVNSER